MSGGVHANPADLRRFAKELKNTRTEIEALAKKLTRTMGSLDWKDSVKTRIEGDVRQVTSGLSKFTARLDDHAKQVEKKAADLERYHS